MQGFGKSRFGKTGGYQNWKLKDGSNVFRILPAMKSGADQGIWTRYIGTHYGYKGLDNRDPTKTRAKPFACIQQENKKTKMVKVECPECTLIQRQKNLLEELEAQAKVDGASKPETAARVAALKDWLKEHNKDAKWVMNVKSPDGQFGILRIPHKAKLALEAAIEKLRKVDGLDPTALENGVWLDFHRTGMDLNSVYAISAVEEMVTDNGRRFKVVKTDTMGEAEANQALETCPDLAEVARLVSYDQVRALVEGTGDPHEVDAILGVSQSRGRGESTPRSEYSPAPMAAPVQKAVFTHPAPAVISAPVVMAGNEDEEEAAAEAAFLAEKAARAAARAAKVSAAPAPVSAASSAPAPEAPKSSTAMSDEDFLKKFGM